jgi:hypothetical protein
MATGNRLTAEGNVKLYKVPIIADRAAPTMAEIEAGVALTPNLPTGGVSINWTQNNASLAMLDESFVVTAVGTEGAEIELTGVRDDGDDVFFSSFERGENFNLVVSRFGEAAAGKKVEVYPSQSHRPVPLSPAENEFQQASVSIGVTDAPEMNAVVA